MQHGFALLFDEAISPNRQVCQTLCKDRLTNLQISFTFMSSNLDILQEITMQTYTNPEHLETLRCQAQLATQLGFLQQQRQKRMRGASRAAKYALRTFFHLLLEPVQGLRITDSSSKIAQNS
jgi:hypothetical protein